MATFIFFHKGPFYPSALIPNKGPDCGANGRFSMVNLENSNDQM